MTLEEQLELAIKVATDAHKGQKDKGGNDYILHPLMVMSLVEDQKEKIAAVLHDVVEDTHITLQMLLDMGFDKEIVDAVDALTKRKGETYDQSLYRAYNNNISRNVKLKDMTVNSDITRIPHPTEKDILRTEKKYKRGILIFTQGNWVFDGLNWNEPT